MAGDFGFELRTFAAEFAMLAQAFVLVAKFGVDRVVAFEQSDQASGTGGRVEQAGLLQAEAFERINQLLAIGTECQAIDAVGDFTILQGSQFLDLAQSDGEDFFEDRFFDAVQQGFEELSGGGAGVETGDKQIATGMGAVIALQAKAPTIVIDIHGARGTLDRGKSIGLACDGKAVQHRAHEPHQRAFARFIGTVQNVQAGLRQRQMQVLPRAKAFYMQVGDAHRECSFTSGQRDRPAR